jgi:hypothetical protein
MATALLAIGAVASVAGTYTSYRNQKKAAAASAQQQQIATRRSRRQAIRQAQIARAQAIASASAQGATGSSASLGGVSALGSQLGSGLGYSTQMSALSGDITRYTSRAQTGQAIAGIGSSMMSLGTNMGGSFSGLFPQNTQRQPLMNFGPQYGASAGFA